MQPENIGISARFLIFASGFVLAVLSAGSMRCQEAQGTSPIKVTIYDLGLAPQKFDGHLVRVRALLAFGWEGDNFLSDPNPQNLPAGSPAYLWFYCKPERQQVCSSAWRAGHSSVYGWFTGYLHYVGKTQIVNGAFDPGHLQLECVEVSIPEKQPRSLADAIREGALEETRKILRSGAKVNIRDEYQVTPLFEAINSHHPDIAEDLIAAGADTRSGESDGSTPLMAAALNGDLRIAKVLLDRGVSVNTADASGQTALIVASHTCPDGKMVQLLLDAGADPNAKAKGGLTSLMAAAGNPVVAEKLLKAGADPTVESQYGQTVEDEACERGEAGHYQVCTLVRQALGKK